MAAAITTEQLNDFRQDILEYNDNLNQLVFILHCVFCIVFMQAGFAMLEAGGCRSKNSKSILYKNGIDLSIGMLIWWLWGFGFSTANLNNFAIRKFDGGFARYFLITVVFCTTSSTIVSGAVVERIRFWVYKVSTITIAGGSYPLVSQWVWANHNSAFSGSAWLAQKGFIDFAGSGVVHLLGAIAAVTSAWWIGPRVGRFTKQSDGKLTVNVLPASDPILCTIGTWIFIFGWLSFNASSSSGYGADSMHISARVVVMTLIAMAASGITGTLLQLPQKNMELSKFNNALLGGLVAITAGCAYVDSVGAFFIGVVAGVISRFGHLLPEFVQIDDPLDVFTVHGLNGAWGVIAVGLFAIRDFTNPDFDYGCFYGGTGHLLGYQLAGALIIILVAFGVAFSTFGLMFVTCKYVLRLPGENPLRISIQEEAFGIDIHEFGGYAYPEQERQVELILQKAKELGVSLEDPKSPPKKKKKRVRRQVGRSGKSDLYDEKNDDSDEEEEDFKTEKGDDDDENDEDKESNHNDLFVSPRKLSYY